MGEFECREHAVGDDDISKSTPATGPCTGQYD